MSIHFLMSKAKLGVLTMAIFWLLTPYEVGAEATHEGSYEILPAVSSILMRNRSRRIITVFVTICPTGGAEGGNVIVKLITPNGDIRQLGPSISAANATCEGVSATLDPRAELDLSNAGGSGGPAAKGTYTISADLD